MRRSFPIAGLLAACLLASSLVAAKAQLALPDATSTPDASSAPDAAAAKPIKKHRTKRAAAQPAPDLPAPDLPAADSPAADNPAANKPAAAPERGIDSILGKALKLNGSQGAMIVNKHKRELSVDQLVLKGESTDPGGRPCAIEVHGDAPMPVKSMGKISGLQRYAIDFPACPIVFDVIDRAVLVPPQVAACVFPAAACQASASGLWGPDAASLQSAAKDIGAKRERADRALNQSLKSLMKRNHGQDAAAVTADEELFATLRDESCKGYDGEADLGFCASRLTIARAANLAARLGQGKAKAATP